MASVLSAEPGVDEHLKGNILVVRSYVETEWTSETGLRNNFGLPDRQAHGGEERKGF